MLLNELALVACLTLLFSTKAATAAASRRGDRPQVRVLHIFRIGLSLSACSYVLHMLGRSAPGPISLLSLVCSFAGILLIWIGWMEHWSLSQQRAKSLLGLPRTQEDDDGDATEEAAYQRAGLPVLNSQAHRVLRQAQDEAARLRQDCVDTDHLLLGLLRVPASAGGHLLAALGVNTGEIQLALGQPPEKPGSVALSPYRCEPPAPAPPLSGRARQVFALAAQEAHRFEKSSVGTDHLLLGLVLMGMGTAAAALFQEGVTVERLRDEILRKPAA